MDETSHAELFKVLSVDSRIRIIELLKQKGPLGVNELSKELGITPSAVSQHLKILRYAGLVRCERKGYCLPYEVDERALLRCREVLAEVCTCGCMDPGQRRTDGREDCGEDMSVLMGYRKQLKEELAQVEDRIRELEEGG